MKTRFLFILGLTAGLSGCLSVLPSPKPAPAVYRLNTAIAPVVAVQGAEIIRVDRPSASQIFSSNDIVVSMDGRKLSAVAMSSWAEATPIIIQGTLVEALEGSSEFVGLLPSSGARTGTRVHLAVKNFEANFDRGAESAPLAVVQYRVTYARADDRKLIGTHLVRETRRADSVNVSSIVSAIEGANQAAVIDIVKWLETQRATDPR
jgi:ABC-type uncharacterized transport system auxiliary subunit